jgi:hypothetical protein
VKEGWKDGRMEEWKSGRMEEWRVGGLEDWRVGFVNCSLLIVNCSGGLEDWRLFPFSIFNFSFLIVHC